MRRFWLDHPQTLKLAEEIELSKDLYHHIVEVCRFQVGEHFELLTADQKAFKVQLKVLGAKRARCLVVEERAIVPLEKPYLHLALSLPKFATMDAIVEKSVELGVKSIKPFVSQFSFVRNTKDVSTAKKVRWQKILRGATQQSGRGDLMEIAEPVTLDLCLKEFAGTDQARGVFAFEGEGGTPIKQALNSNLRSDHDIWIFVGSEGGFAKDEVAQFASMGLKPVTLGAQVLRVETACVALVSIIKYEVNGFA